jgi:LuxR family maltose regulon positive regulatory protein
MLNEAELGCPPPVRADTLPRTRLLQRFDDEVLRRPLSLVVAPAGFGKTSLLVQWAVEAREQASFCWLSLNVRHDDPARFWRSLLHAIQGQVRGSSNDAEAPPGGEISPDRVLDALLANTDAAPDRHLVLVLDDYHVIHSAAIHAGMSHLVGLRVPRVHIVLSSRSDPALTLARLRANGELAEVRAADLRFSTAETATLLGNATGLALSTEQVEALDARTEGWAAGLQLAALSLRRAGDVADAIARFTGSDRFVIDYFVEEVLNGLPERSRRFLEMTSVLDQMNGALCDALLGECGSAAMLEELEYANIFLTAVDHSRTWFRCHQLLAEVLRHTLRRDHPDVFPEMHERASRWFAANGSAEQAVEHALAACNWVFAAELMAPLMRGLLQRGEERTIDRWLRALPHRLCLEHPILSAYRASSLLQMGALPEAGAFVAEAGPALESAGHTGTQGKVLAVHAMAAAIREDRPTASTCAEQALNLLPNDQTGYRGNALNALVRVHLQRGELVSAEHTLQLAIEMARVHQLPIIGWESRSNLGMLTMLQGRLSRAVVYFEELLDLVADRHVFHSQLAFIGLAGVAYAQNRLDDAAGYLDRYVDARQRAGRSGELPYPCILRALIARAQRRPEVAAASLARAEAAARAFSSTRLLRVSAALRARGALDAGDRAAATVWANEVLLDPAGLDTFAREPELLVLARVSIVEGMKTEIRPLLESALAKAESDGRASSTIPLSTALALVRDRDGDRRAALTALQRAITLAAPERHTRVFLDVGSCLEPLLRTLSTARVAAPFATDLLRELDCPLEPPSGLTRLVTTREREVLNLVALGLSNRSIAERLVTSEATIKSHIHRLISKLGVENRAQVVIRARQLGALVSAP